MFISVHFRTLFYHLGLQTNIFFHGYECNANKFHIMSSRIMISLYHIVIPILPLLSHVPPIPLRCSKKKRKKNKKNELRRKTFDLWWDFSMLCGFLPLLRFLVFLVINSCCIIWNHRVEPCYCVAADTHSVHSHSQFQVAEISIWYFCYCYALQRLSNWHNSL